MSSSRPVTPSHRKSMRKSSGLFGLYVPSPRVHYPLDSVSLPLESPHNIELFEQLCDSVQELELYMGHLRNLHNNISQGFNESFSSLLYGLSISMWCIEYPAIPSKELAEKVERSKEIDNNINYLEDRIKEARKQNEILKTKLQSKARAANVLKQKSTNQSNRRVLKPDSKVPVRYGGARTNAASSSRTAGTRATATKPPVPRQPVRSPYNSALSNPNLNQRPRYMDGLFDKTTPNPRRPASKPVPQRTAYRPPFR